MASFACLAAGCFAKTPYEQAGYRGGYNDIETQPGTHFVSFAGNGFTTRDEVIAGWHQRAAEVCGGYYEVLGQSTDTERSGTAYVSGTATTRGNQTQIEATVREPMIRKSRAEGYVRCTDAPSAPVGNETWWCFAGELGGKDVGLCRASLESCAEALAKAIEKGMDGDTACDREVDVSCFGATRGLDGERVITCFPASEICTYEHDRLAATEGWSDVSSCMSAGSEPAIADPGEACDSGDAAACMALAQESQEAGDSTRALSYVAKACKAGAQDSCMQAGKALELGEGIEANPSKAAAFYKAACKLGDDGGCESFARVRTGGGSESAPEASPEP